ncbi:DUF305 domain-containing protein [Ornithinimicrobium tianjinense]|uniref:DUF305 domain-containing protein n=1 Tax=Ornithinimicrobium tianjinense TaxID=1195761 RepID=A0A917BH53_9MICO|nr:DUF305 domain-containing protein [Ornithinimicrobium tianjinense]GGF41114.1 DUF305 domain-containing protein [Ornithinimicrobium tianjinense]
MNARRLTLPTITLPTLTLATLLIAGCATETDGHDAGHPESSSAPTSAGTTSTATEDAGAEAHNDADVAFAQGMVPHHAQAVEMADLVLAHDGSTLTDLAEQVKAAQQPEIDQLTEWLTAWGEEVPEGGGEHAAHGSEGMMSAEDMASLEAAQGEEFDLMWLEMMIEHHEGAIAMAQDEVDAGEHPDAVAMAEQIVSTQEAEVEAMRGMIADLEG